MPANAALIGGLVGGTCLLLLIAVVAIYAICRRRRSARITTAQNMALHSVAPRAVPVSNAPTQYQAMPARANEYDAGNVELAPRTATEYADPAVLLDTRGQPALI
jgi:hypothetical protein